MITRILLPLLWLFFVSSFPYDHYIDWDRCTTDSKCFVRESCVEGKTGPESINELVRITSGDIVSNGCDVILQMRSYTTKKFHIMIQVNASEYAQDVTREGIKLMQEAEQFKCQESGVT
ncbi:hypothetical protein PMAYCL1PPCAC_07650, partial [Pristionchus mayeri]